MPCPSWGISPHWCQTGSKLREKKGTICSKCYACKGQYLYENVAYAHQRRLEGLGDIRWVLAMTTLIRATKTKFFRWFDSGDLQSPTHFDRIRQIAVDMPEVKFWMPTMEYKWVINKDIPDNLTVRASSPVIGKPRSTNKLPISMVEKKTNVEWRTLIEKNSPHDTTHYCPAPIQGNKCEDCRACWDKSKKIVVYKQH